VGASDTIRKRFNIVTSGKPVLANASPASQQLLLLSHFTGIPNNLSFTTVNYPCPTAAQLCNNATNVEPYLGKSWTKMADLPCTGF